MKRIYCLYWTLGILFGPPLLCIGVLLIGNYYGPRHMAQVNRDLFALAEQVGYTPNALLRHEVYSPNFGFSLYPGCEASLYYTTTLSPAEFRERVEKALPETSWQGRPRPAYQVFVPELHINANEVVTSYSWVSFNDSKIDVSLTYYDLANVSAPVDYKGLPVTGNVVELNKSGGSVQMLSCPVRTTEITPPLVN